MKNFFEFLGFVFTAIVSGVFIFALIGRSDRKSSGLTERSEMVSEQKVSKKGKKAEEIDDLAAEVSRSTRSEQDLPELPKIAKKNAKNAPAAPVENDGIETPDLQELYTNRSFVNKTIQYWKNAVADVADQHSVKPEALLAHVVVQSYLTDYTQSQLRKDAARHAGDVVMSADAAAKRYDKGWSVREVMSRYNMAQYFPEPVETAYAGMGKNARKAAPALSAKSGATAPVTTVSKQNGQGRSANFKDMVAKEHGAKDWKSLESKADAATKAKAEKRAKMLTTASIIR